MDNSSSKAMAVVLVILLMGGSVALFFMMEMMHQMNPDIHEESHEYIVSGTLYGEDCTGTGSSSYAPENNQTYVYAIKLEAKSANHSENIKFPVIFDRYDKMESDLYTYEGVETIGELSLEKYSRVDKGVDYTFYVEEHCKIVRMTLECEDYDITADIKVSA